MMSLQETILRYIDEQLDAMEKRPRMWGPDLCVELQFLQLLEFRSVTLRPELERANPRVVLDAYSSFLAGRFPGARPVPLASLLASERREHELMKFLGEFRSELVGRMQPEGIPLIGAHRSPVAERRRGLLEPALPRLARAPTLKQPMAA